MNIPSVIKEGRRKVGLRKKDLARILDISEMHVYDLESYDNELKETLTIEQIYKLAEFLNILPENLCNELKHCHITNEQSFGEIKHLINQTQIPVNMLSEKIGWDLEFCASSTTSIKKQPIMFFIDLATWFNVSLKSVLPNTTSPPNKTLFNNK